MDKLNVNKLMSLSEFINEAAKGKQIVVSYSGKFQPFHFGHMDIYEQLVKKFGKQNVYITTADLNPKYIGKKDYDNNHVFTFDEKKLIISKMFGIPTNRIVKVANTYAPKELTGMFSKDTAYITVVGGKDAERLKKGKYFEEYSDDKDLLGYFDKGYYFIQENRPGVKMSATEVRNYFRDPKNDDKAKRNFFKKLYGKMNEDIYQLIDKKLQEFVANHLNENIDLTLLHRINEGGAFGHLEHIYDDYTLTFAQLKELINLGLSGKLENSVEKTDGQALAVSFKNGKLVTARNKGEYKNFGEKAADKSAIKEKFAGRGEISDAYMFAFDDLEKAIAKIPKKEVDEIFQEGKKFMHLEVMYIPTTNTVPYNVNLLVFHNVTEYDEAGNPIAQSRKDSDKLAKLIKEVNANVQKTFEIQGSPYIKFKDGVDFEKEKKIFIDKITKLQKKWGLTEQDTLLDFYIEEWREYLQKIGVDALTSEQLNGLILRWSGNDKTFRLNAKTIPDPEMLQWAKDFEKSEAKKINTKIKRTIETLFIEVAMVIIKSLKTFLAANPDESTKQLKVDLSKAIEDIKKSGDESALEKMKKHLERLELVGGMDAVFPSEGIVFDYNGKMYKLTGSFTDVHHIISTLKYKK